VLNNSFVVNQQDGIVTNRLDLKNVYYGSKVRDQEVLIIKRLETAAYHFEPGL
jgi:hypothetical protein